MNRRHFVMGAGAIGGLAFSAKAAADPIDIPDVKLPIPEATPAATALKYSGPISDLWKSPWLLEGKTIELDGTILQRLVAPTGRGYRISNDGITFRSMIDLDVPGGGGRGEVFVVTNDDLGAIAGMRTLHVKGIYGGIADSSVNGSSGIPIVIALTINGPRQ
jgi:hypothetical protein